MVNGKLDQAYLKNHQIFTIVLYRFRSIQIIKTIYRRCAVYFDEQMGASHAVFWSNHFFQCFKLLFHLSRLLHYKRRKKKKKCNVKGFKGFEALPYHVKGFEGTIKALRHLLAHFLLSQQIYLHNMHSPASWSHLRPILASPDT